MKRGRPSTGLPHKQRLNLTVTEQTRLELEYISNSTSKSISQLVAEFASREAKKVAKANGCELPSVEQTTL